MLEISLGAIVLLSTLIFLGLIAIDVAGLLRRGEKRRPITRDYGRRVLVIIPCKGLDLGLHENLISIKNQNCKNYDLVAVLDSPRDKALGPVRKAGVRYIISDSVCTRCSGKVRAISTAMERFRDYDVYVIADSDIRVGRTWLKTLISPLSDEGIGISTMFPYFNPVGGFWSRIKHVWGFVGDGLMDSESTRFGWGGSIAFRKDLLDKDSFEFFKNSRYSVSDDTCLTMITKKKGLRIAYVRTARPVINSEDDFDRFSEWSSRQTALSILGNRRNLYMGIAFYSAELITLLSGLLFATFVSPFFLVFFLHYLRGVALAYRRSESRSPMIAPIVLIMPFIYLVNLLKANSMKSIEWRGVRYNLAK